MTGNAGEGTVQIDHMQPLGAPLLPDDGHGRRIVRINGRPSEVSLDETHAPAFFQIDGRNDNHQETP